MRIDFLYKISPKVIGVRGMKAFIDYQQLSGLTRVEIGDDAKAEGHWENSENYIHFIIPNIESDRVSFDNGELFIGEVDYIGLKPENVQAKELHEISKTLKDILKEMRKRKV